MLPSFTDLTVTPVAGSPATFTCEGYGSPIPVVVVGEPAGTTVVAG